MYLVQNSMQPTRRNRVERLGRHKTPGGGYDGAPVAKHTSSKYVETHTGIEATAADVRWWKR